MQTLAAPGLQQVPAALQAFLPLQQGSNAPQLLQRLRQGDTLQFTRLQQRRQAGHQRTALQQELIGEQAGQIDEIQTLAVVVASADRLQAPLTQVGLLQIRNGRPEMAVMGDGEILQFAFAQLLANRGPMPRAVQIQPQQIGLTALPLPGFTRLLVTAGAPMPTLALHLLAQVVLELKR